ncbi:MAG: amidohydrolase family protein [bacterium]
MPSSDQKPDKNSGPHSDPHADRPAQITLHRAAWILPISSPPIRDGIVAVRDGRILEAGAAQSMRKKYGRLEGIHQPAEKHLVDYGDGAILPSLVNAHTHLELSCLAGRVQAGAGFVGWIKNLILARERCKSRDVEAGILAAIEELRQRGTGLVGDVSNTGLSIPFLRESSLKGIVFVEAIGFQPQKERENWKYVQYIIGHYSRFSQGAERGVHICLAAHAPYSVSSRYMQLLQKDQHALDEPFSIHVAESTEESTFLSTGEGEFRQFLIDRGGWDPDWGPPKTTPVQYLSRLGALRGGTICVHAVWVDDEDIDILAMSGSHPCICPRSNHTLGVGRAPVEKFLQRGISPCLGTDSLASNSSLCLWQEMSFLKNAIPSLPCNQILKMATLSGSLALGEREFGSIEAGKYASLIFLPVTASSVDAIEEALVTEGQEKEVRWVST